MASSLPLQIIMLGTLCALVAGAAWTDLRDYRIPNRISIAIAACYPVYVLAGGADWRGGLLAGFLVFSVGVFLYARDCMGGGDVKLLAAVSLWAGTDLVLPTLLIVTIVGGVMSAVEWVRTGGFNRLMARHIPVFDAGIGGNVAVRRAVVPYAVAILAGALYVVSARAAQLFASQGAF